MTQRQVFLNIIGDAKEAQSPPIKQFRKRKAAGDQAQSRTCVGKIIVVKLLILIL